MKLMDIIMGKKRHEDVGLSIVYFVGAPDSGKTTLSNFLIREIMERAGRSNVWYVRTRKVADVFTEVNPSRYYQVFFVDDAMAAQSARRSMSGENVELYTRLPDVRHIAEKMGMRAGHIIIFVASQLPQGVDLIVRDFSKVWVFKSMNLLEDSHRRVLERIHISPYEVREWITAVMAHEPWALSRALIVLPSGVWGWLTFEKREPVKPDKDLYAVEIPAKQEKEDKEKSAKLAESVESLEDLIKQELKSMVHVPKWRTHAIVLKKIMIEHKTYIEIANETGIKEGSIRYLKEVGMGELVRRVGLAYEELTARKLTEMGYKNVERHGGESEPDITAEKDGVKLAVSVKLYNYGRARHTLRREEFKPEIAWAKEHNGEAWIYYTNMAWGQTFFFEIPKYGDIITIVKNKGLIGAI